MSIQTNMTRVSACVGFSEQPSLLGPPPPTNSSTSVVCGSKHQRHETKTAGQNNLETEFLKMAGPSRERGYMNSFTFVVLREDEAATMISGKERKIHC